MSFIIWGQRKKHFRPPAKSFSSVLSRIHTSVQRKSLKKKSVLKSNTTLNVLMTLSAMLAAFCQKFSVIVVENAFSVPRETFWWKKVFWKDIQLSIIRRHLGQGFQPSAKSYCQSFREWLLCFRRNILRKNNCM